jgi:hypothetical protein
LSLWTLLPHLALLLSLTLATWQALRTRTSLELSLYLAVELWTTEVLELSLWALDGDFNSPTYTVVYCLMRPLELAAALYLAKPRRMAFAVALVAFLACFLSLKALSLNSMIALVESAVFEFAGLSALYGKDLNKRILAGMWLALAVFDVGYAKGWELPQWALLNQYWPYFICTAAFTLVWLRLRPSAGQRAQA